jgi:2-polyprenyl-6-methoxyphenol hydroxylase-like FAD-dependent oxidoreductase
MEKIKLIETALTRVDVLRALATGIQNVPIELEDGEVVYAVDAKQSGNTLTVTCTDGSTVNLTVTVG